MGITGSGWSTCAARIYMGVILLITLVSVESKRTPGWLDEHRWDRLETGVGPYWLWGAPCRHADFVRDRGVFRRLPRLLRQARTNFSFSGHEIALNCAALTFMVPLGISFRGRGSRGTPIGKRRSNKGRTLPGGPAILLGAGFMTCTGLVFVTSFEADCAAVYPPIQR